MSKIIILVDKPMRFRSHCDVCQKETDQIFTFVTYIQFKHEVHYRHGCIKCGTSGVYKTNVQYWIKTICDQNNSNDN